MIVLIREALAVAKKPTGLLASGSLAVGTRDLQRREKGSLGQDQLVFAGYAQQVALAGVFDFDGLRALQQAVAGDAGPGGRHLGLAWLVGGLWRWISHDMKT